MYEISKSQLDNLTQVLDQIDPEGYSIRGDYSGRAMYGASCFGIDLEQFSGVNELTLGVVFGQVFGDDAVYITEQYRRDSMGCGTIVYFPGVTVEDDADDDE